MTTVDLFNRAHATDTTRNAGRMILRLATSGATAVLRAAVRWHRQRQDRAAFNTLLGAEDWVYEDLGVHRGDVVWASRLPLHVNAARELEKVREESSGNL